jgi:hypothetical protein
MMQSPEFMGLIFRQMNGEKIENSEFLQALASTKPDTAAIIVKAIVKANSK